MRITTKYILVFLLILSILSTSYLLGRFTPQSSFEANICLHIWDYSDKTVAYLKDLNVKWVRTDWQNTPNISMANYSQPLQENGVNLLTIIDTNTFDCKNFTIQEWNNAVTELVSSSNFSDVDAVEVWNEPNAKAYIAPETYYEMIKSAYTIIKSYRSIPIVFAGVSPNVDGWQQYLAKVFATGDIVDYFDYMGIHLYDDETTNLNTLQYIKNLTHKPVWVTETGRPSINNEKEQAEYLRSIHDTISSKVSKIFVYELNDGQGADPPKENYFGLLTINGSKKQAYNIILNINRVV